MSTTPSDRSDDPWSLDADPWRLDAPAPPDEPWSLDSAVGPGPSAGTAPDAGPAPDTASAPPGALPTRYAQDGPPPLGLARRTSPLTVGIEIAALLASTLVELLTRQAGDTPSSMWDPGLATIPLLLLGPRVLGWWFRTYTLTESHLELDEGILRRRHRVVPYSRVQQIDLRQNVLSQVFGLAALHIETAGEGGAGAVSLSLLQLDDAESLRRFVLDRRDGATTGRPADQAPPTQLEYALARMTPADLLLSAVTQAPGMLFGLVVVVALPWLLAAGPAESVDVIAVLGFLLVASLLISVVRVVMRLLGDWGWTLTSRGDDLHLRAGSLQIREQSLPRRRIQQVTIVDNPVRRLFGLTSVVLHTAVPAGTQQGISTLVEVPLLRRAQLDPFVEHVMGAGWVVPPLEPRRPAAGRRAVLRRMLLLVPGGFGPGLLWGGSAWLTAVLIVLALPWGRAAQRIAGHAVDSHLLALSSGVLHHRIDLVPLDRIQSARASSSPFQRRVDLATFHVDVAGATWLGPLTRSPRLFDMDAATAERLHRTLPM